MTDTRVEAVLELELADLDGDGDLDLFANGGFAADPSTFTPEVHLYDDLAGYGELAGAVDPAAALSSRSAAALGDLDGDGDVDAYRVSAGYALTALHEVLLGDGTGRFVLAPAATTWSAASTAVAAVDLDLDGDLDVVSNDASSPLSSALNVHVNGGAGVFSTFQVPLPATPVEERGDVAVGDVDADGLPDVVVTTGAQPLLVRNGPGLSLSHVPSAIQGGSPSTEVELGDLDGDGKLDLVSGCRFPDFPFVATDLVYRGDGLGGFTLVASLPGLHATTALELGDLDGDGDLDAVLAWDVSWTDPSPGQAALRNDGGMAFAIAAPGLASIWTFCEDMAIADVDGDGDQDVAPGSMGVETRLLLGDGALGLSDRASASPLGPAVGALLLADLDGDGDLDGWASAPAGQVQRNPGDGVFVADPAATAGVLLPFIGDESHAVTLDANADGALDVYQARRSVVQDVLYLNDGAGSFSSGGFFGLATEMAAAGDVDGDGDPDLALAYADALLLNDGTGLFSPAPGGIPTQPPGIADYSRAIALEDLDLDGDLDLVRGNNGLEPTWNENVGGSGQPFGAETPIPGVFFEARDLATFDADVDGDADLLFATPKGPVLLRNELSGVFTDVSAGLPSHAFFNGSDVAVGDFDGDGDQDFVHPDLYFYGDSRYVLYLQQPGGAFSDGSSLVQTGLGYVGGVAAGDVDGDEDVDLVAAEHVGRLLTLTNHARQLARRGLPRVGKDLALDVSGPAGEPWALAISPGAAAIPLAPFGVLKLDPVGLNVVASGGLDAAGQAAAVGLMPPGPGAVGLTVYAQAVVGLAPRLTNLEIVTLTAF